MDKEEAKTVLRSIKGYFPSFMKDENKEQARLWMKQLLQGDYDMTMAKLEHYARREAFPPHLAHIIHIDQTSKVEDKLQADMDRVRAEKADPKLAKERDEKLKRLQALLAGGGNNE